MRQSFGRNQLYLDLTPAAILSLVRWTVSEYILVAQLYSNLGSHVGQFVGIIDGKHAAAGHVADFGQQGRAGNLLRRGRSQAEDADRINLDIGLFNHRFDLVFSVTAVVIAAIGDDQQGFLGVVSVL